MTKKFGTAKTLRTTPGSAIGRITARARRLLNLNESRSRELALILLDLNSGDCPLRLTALARAELFDLSHDVFGLLRWYDPATGKLLGSFCPRYAAA